MTRINLIEPGHLTRRHLVAEYKELTQFLYLVKKRVDKNDPFDDLPEKYSLNGGHCKFFYDKGKYLYKRYMQLYEEMKSRGVNVDEDKFSNNLKRIRDTFPDNLFNDYQPDARDFSVVIDRINERIREKPQLYPDADVFFSNTERYKV